MTSETAMNRKKHQLNPAEKKVLTGRIRSLLETEYPEIVAAYLFGSFTEKDSVSDVDIGILMKETPQKSLELEFKLENDLERVLKLPVDVCILNKAPLSFCYNVIRQKN
jgi:hypothetical protein